MFDDILGKDERVKPVIDGKLGNVKPASVGGVNGPDGMNPNKKDPKDPTAISKPSIFDAIMDDDPDDDVWASEDDAEPCDDVWASEDDAEPCDGCAGTCNKDAEPCDCDDACDGGC